MSYLYNTPAYNKYKETLAGKRNPIINTECDIELVNQDDFLAFDDEETFRELCTFLEAQPSDQQAQSDTSSSYSDGVHKRKWSGDTATGFNADMTSFEGMTAMQAGNHLTSTEWKRIRKESAKVKKRIPDDDIRRRLAPIFADAYNKCDASLFDQLLVKYSIPDCVVVYKYAGGNNPYGVNYAEIIGREAVVAFWDTLFCSIPDAIFELHETKIRLLSTDFCSIGCKFVFTGTKLFRMSTDDLEAVKYSRDGKKTAIESACKALNQSEASASTTSSTSPVPVPVDVSVDSQSEAAVKPKDVTLGPTLDQSIDVTLIGTLTFFVNPEKQIYKFEFIHCVKQ